MSNSSRKYRRHGVNVETCIERDARVRRMAITGWKWLAWCAFALLGALALAILIAVPMHAQRLTNTFNVYDFRQSAATQTVGDMTTAAQNQCQGSLNCIIIFDPILGGYPTGSMPAKCANCTWIDYRVPGSFTVTPTNVKIQNGVRFADQFAGINAAAQITAACNDLSGPGLVFVSSTMGSGLPATLPAGCTLYDYRGNTGNGGVFIGRQPCASVCDTQNGLSVFLYASDAAGVNMRAIIGDASNVMGGPASTNFVGVQGFAQTPAGAGVGGTNYGGFQATISGTVSSSGTTVTGSGTSFCTTSIGCGNNPGVGDYLTPVGSRSINCLRVVTAVGSGTSLTVNAGFNSGGCPGDLPGGSQLYLVVSGDGTHGDGTHGGVGGTVGALGGAPTGNMDRAPWGVRGVASNVNYGFGVSGIHAAAAGKGAAGQFCRTSGSSTCINDSGNKAVLDVEDTATSASGSGQEVARFSATTSNAQVNSGPLVVFGNAGSPSTAIGRFGFQVEASNQIGFHVQTFNSGLADAFQIDALKNAVLFNHLNQSATRNTAGTCAMAAGTSCTFSLTAAFTSAPGCVATVQSATVIAGGCTVSGTTVTITAASSNSSTWAALLFGNPN